VNKDQELPNTTTPAPDAAIARSSRSIRWVVPALVVGALIGAAVTYVWAPNAATDAVAVVNGQKITKQQLYDLLIQTQPGPVALQQLITQQLVLQDAAKNHINVTSADADAALNKVKATFPSDAAFQQALQQGNLTESAYRAQMPVQVALQKLLAPEIHITTAQEQDYFNANKDQYATQPEQVKASHILVNTQQEALDIKKQLDNGANFATLAKEKSIDTGSKDQGGELGYFTKDKMDPGFAAAAFSMKVGQISGPVKSQYGYHIIKVEDIKPGVYSTFAKVKSKIYDVLFNQAVGQKAPALLQKLKASAHIQTLLPSDAAPLPTAPPTTTG